MARIGDGGDLLKCSFCGKSQKQVKKLIAGPGVYICDECIDLCNEIIEEELADADDVKLDELPKPAEIREFLEADSVGYLSLEGMLSAVKTEKSAYCTSCYTGIYPVEFPRDEATYLQLALKLDSKGEPVTK